MLQPIGAHSVARVVCCQCVAVAWGSCCCTGRCCSRLGLILLHRHGVAAAWGYFCCTGTVLRLHASRARLHVNETIKLGASPAQPCPSQFVHEQCRIARVAFIVIASPRPSGVQFGHQLRLDSKPRLVYLPLLRLALRNGRGTGPPHVVPAARYHIIHMLFTV